MNEGHKTIIKLIDELKCIIFKAVNNLKQSLNEDLEEKTKLVFRGTELDDKNDEVLREFIVSKLRVECLGDINTRIEVAKFENKGVEWVTILLEAFKVDWEEYVSRLEDEIFECILKGVEYGVEKRVEERPKVYNFLNEDIPVDLKMILERGKKFVPFLVENEFEAEAKFKEEVLNYLVRYRKYVEGGTEIVKNDYNQWLDDALDEAAVWKHEDYHTNFYKRVKLEARVALKTIMNRKRVRFDLEEEKGRFNIQDAVKKLMELDDGVVVENDKNNGWSLMPCKAVFEAEKKMMEAMNGIEVEMNEDSIIEVIDDEIKRFECGLSGDQLLIINKFYLKRRIQKDEVKMPFLRLTLKVHKLTEEDKRLKKFSAFKFRPLQDSTFCSLVVYNRIMMEMTRELGDRLKSIEQKVSKLDSKSGGDFSERLRNTKLDGKTGVVLLSGDFTDAYSNINFEDVSRAIVVVGRFVGLQEDRLELMIELASLILKNNYVSCSEENYHLDTSLPMGNSCSGKIKKY